MPDKKIVFLLYKIKTAYVQNSVLRTRSSNIIVPLSGTSKSTPMERYCGLDVHKDSVFMCIIDEFGFKKEHKFSTLTSDLYLLRESMLDSGVKYVAMESTNIYWIFIWRLLVEHFDVKLVNPLFIKQLPGRKTDVKDAHWIATVLMKGLVCGSYVPDQAIQGLRQYERCYSRLNKKIVSCEQFIDMQLQR